METILWFEEKIHKISIYSKKTTKFVRENLTYIQIKKTIKKQGIRVFMTFSFINLLLTIFSLKFLLSLVLFFFSLFLYSKEKINNFQKNGLLYYLPYEIKKLLLRRSIFDFFCDLWYFSTIKIYLKALIGPFFLKRSAKDARKSLSIIPKKGRKLFFTKGIIYTFPKNFQKIFFPKNTTIHNKIRDFVLTEEVEENKREEEIDFVEIKNNKLNKYRSHSKITDSDDDRETNNEDTSHKSFLKNKSVKRKKSSNVIISSKMIRDIQFIPGKINFEWDNYDLYKKLEKETQKKIKAKKKKRENDEVVKEKNVQDILSPLNMVMNLIDYNKKKILHKISYKVLISLFSVSSLVLVFKLVYSKRLRKLTKNFLVGSTFAFFVLSSFLSLVLMLMKPKNKIERQISFENFNKLKNLKRASN